MRQTKEVLEVKGVKCDPGLFEDGEAMTDLMRGHVGRFAGSVQKADDLAFDMTPGTKLMSLGLATIAPRGSAILYLRHHFLVDQKRAEPGTERLERWTVGERLELPKEIAS
jgi:hypothetical protein